MATPEQSLIGRVASRIFNDVDISKTLDIKGKFLELQGKATKLPTNFPTNSQEGIGKQLKVEIEFRKMPVVSQVMRMALEESG